MIIGISGKARSGKDTFALMLAEELNKRYYPPFVMMAFANELKQGCQRAFDLSYEQLWGDDKEIPDKRYMRHPRPYSSEPADGKLPDTYWTAREIMQNYGAFFRTIDAQYWIKYLFKVAAEKEYPNFIITDVRYSNEADYIANKGGYVVRVERENKDDVHNMQHPSETDLDDYKRFDFTVVNNWGLDELKQAAADVARFLQDSEKAFEKLNLKETNHGK